MTERGDVLEGRRVLGFGAGASGERYVVVQATSLNSALTTTLAVPLDASPHAAPPSLGVRVSAAEVGSDREHIAVPTHVQVLLLDRFLPGRRGRLRPGTLAELEEKLRLVLDL